MKNKISKRKSKHKLLLQWTVERGFAVPVTPRSLSQKSLLKSSTISIHLKSARSAAA